MVKLITMTNTFSIIKTHGNMVVPIEQSAITHALAEFKGLEYNVEKNQIEPVKDKDFVLHITDGEIWTQSPTDNVIDIMVLLSTLLDARVRDRNNRTYRSHNNTYVHVDDAMAVQPYGLLPRFTYDTRFRYMLLRWWVPLTIGLVGALILLFDLR